MPYNSNLHNRNSIRMQGYDYTQIGSYFITICTRHKECLLGEITDGKMKLSSLGEIVYCQWLQLPNRFSNIILDAFIIMPNHIHGIVIINGENPPRRGEAGENRHNSSANNLISPVYPTIMLLDCEGFARFTKSRTLTTIKIEPLLIKKLQGTSWYHPWFCWRNYPKL